MEKCGWNVTASRYPLPPLGTPWFGRFLLRASISILLHSVVEAFRYAGDPAQNNDRAGSISVSREDQLFHIPSRADSAACTEHNFLFPGHRYVHCGRRAPCLGACLEAAESRARAAVRGSLFCLVLARPACISHPHEDRDGRLSYLLQWAGGSFVPTAGISDHSSLWPLATLRVRRGTGRSVLACFIAVAIPTTERKVMRRTLCRWTTERETVRTPKPLTRKLPKLRSDS